ncbi:MAG TPA: cobyric acid synthase [Gemmataceae bacterium]|jgi:adenosylcobyric acid synthase|nr:cobyric acid synthase [Gemmataceae bacterium]
MTAKTLMVMGTSSSVGKSLLVAALCRIYARRGVRVAPFKAQNMSNNAAVCASGAEIGRAQAVQARAAGLEPCADMNPVLLKPEGHTRAQVIVLGKPWETLHASRYLERKSALWSMVTAALDRLRAHFDLIVIEGAGSPVELNLKDGDIVNMAVARHAHSPVLLVGDIDKGGIFAQFFGTLWLLPPQERALVRGLVVNKFRGDASLFTDGLRILEARGEVPVLGVIPFLPDLAIPEEDAVALDAVSNHSSLLTPHSSLLTPFLDIAILRLPHIANFDDFDPLAGEPGVRVRYVSNGAGLGSPHALVVPGTKSTMADLTWLRERGLDKEIQRLAGAGVAIVGICGGFQMLGHTLRDPEQVESSVRVMPGLGLLPLDTSFVSAKITQRVSAQVVAGPGWFQSISGQDVEGYEIHMGRTIGGRPWLEWEPPSGQGPARGDGAASADGKIWGCYLHGLFANTNFRRAWLQSLSDAIEHVAGPAVASSPAASLDAALDHLADAVEAALDMRQLQDIISVSGLSEMPA